MSILPQFPRRFLKESAYVGAEFRSVEVLRGIRVLTLNYNGTIVRLHGIHAEQWMQEHRARLSADFLIDK